MSGSRGKREKSDRSRVKETVGHVEMVLSGMPFFVGDARVVAYHFARDGYAAVVISGVGDHQGAEAGAAVGTSFWPGAS